MPESSLIGLHDRINIGPWLSSSERERERESILNSLVLVVVKTSPVHVINQYCQGIQSRKISLEGRIIQDIISRFNSDISMWDSHTVRSPGLEYWDITLSDTENMNHIRQGGREALNQVGSSQFLFVYWLDFIFILCLPFFKTYEVPTPSNILEYFKWSGWILKE